MKLQIIYIVCECEDELDSWGTGAVKGPRGRDAEPEMRP